MTSLYKGPVPLAVWAEPAWSPRGAGWINCCYITYTILSWIIVAWWYNYYITWSWPVVFDKVLERCYIPCYFTRSRKCHTAMLVSLVRASLCCISISLYLLYSIKCYKTWTYTSMLYSIKDSGYAVYQRCNVTCCIEPPQVLLDVWFALKDICHLRVLQWPPGTKKSILEWLGLGGLQCLDWGYVPFREVMIT